eukprot:Blabericola_migrator_1__12644@NODE_806_length_6438_cov_127_513734_g571_i0_p7_GENE_NODE_806_length_6438_cov_127_513734_g571_i0NODE_806_length_6438_cov_127_513734_g571_i0_p7_ORF_typecomplete_len140_score17_06DUF3410/PF11890_8/0_028Chitin_synth_1N/PF08407_11/0_23_NODE_806_length_6438_cov_127_513734_g571_i024472866
MGCLQSKAVETRPASVAGHNQPCCCQAREVPAQPPCCSGHDCSSRNDFSALRNETSTVRNEQFSTRSEYPLRNEYSPRRTEYQEEQHISGGYDSTTSHENRYRGNNYGSLLTAGAAGLIGGMVLQEMLDEGSASESCYS